MSCPSLLVSLTGLTSGTDLYPPARPGLSSRIDPVIDCLLVNTTESSKANMAAAAVTLGLLPTILGLAGSNIMETSILALRRPLLALILSAASPSVSSIWSSEYRDPSKVLAASLRRRVRIEQTAASIRRATFVCILEYFVALGALANIAHTTWQLCQRVVFSFAPEIIYGPILFATLAPVLHLAGALALYLRVRLRLAEDPAALAKGNSVLFWLRHEFTLCKSQPKAMLDVLPYDSTIFLLASCFTSICVVLYIIYGTFMFSSALFITLGDGLGVGARYLFSTLLCRAVLNYELGGIKLRVTVSEEQEVAEQRGRYLELESLVELRPAYSRADSEV